MTDTSTPTLEELFERLGSDRIGRHVPLAPMTTFKVGGPADLLYHARTADELTAAVRAARDTGTPYFLLGRGANILVGDGGFRGLIIHSAVESIEFLDGDRVRSGAGVDMYPDLIEATVSRGLGGLHHFVGIPSSVGGALWQNLHFLAPAPERERTVFIAEALATARILTQEGQLRTVDGGYFEFGYDYSILHVRDDIVLEAVFQLTVQPEDELRRVMEENLEWRSERHPDLDRFPCAGSIFQKIEGLGAGRLIDECGLKGHRYGSAEIFRGHANIIVNLGGATAAEVRHLIDLAQSTVATELGYELVPEITFVGDF
ncbi:MAG: UDP-N-acetylmuramate dehydrogenase [Gemmatimonadota bacterium]|nr:MAG: UDP-N-acetylmuramate dehydrogenase [Gemmatimonadota bacterium]